MFHDDGEAARPRPATPEVGRRRAAPRVPALDLAVQRLAFWGVLAILGILFLISSAVGALLALLLPVRRRAPCGRAIMRHGFRLALGMMRATGFCTCDLRALDALAGARGLVIAPNHPSLLDVMLVVSRVPNVVCVTKAGLWDNPLLGGMVRLAGFIRNDAPLSLVRSAAAELQTGANLLIFPEGTRTRPGAALNALRPGFALMAKAGRAPVQTVFLYADTPYLRKGWSILRRPPLPLAYRARLGALFDPAGQPTAAFVAELEAYCRAELDRGPAP